MVAINSINNRFLNQPVITTAISYTASINDVIIEVTNTNAARTITLPAPATTGNIGKAFLIKDTSGSAATNNITITPTSGTIDGQASVFIASNFGSVQIFCDGTNYYSYGISPTGSFIVKEQVFTSSGTYTPTAGMLYCEVQIVGGGGGGGGAAATSSGQWSVGAGGGSGEYAVGFFSSSQVGGSQAITIGAGGTANSGATGGTGGTTSFGSLLTAIGGSGGVAAASGGSTNTGGALGGTGGAGGNYRIPGGAGGLAEFTISASILIPGFGGTSHFGSGGVVNSIPGTGGTGLGYGAGGAGSSQTVNPGSALSGGAGSAGVVFVTEYIATASANLPTVALAKGNWNRQTSSAFIPGATVVATSFASDPGSTPSNSGSRVDLTGLTQTEGSGLTIAQFQVTITQAGTYQIFGSFSPVNNVANNAILQGVKNSTTVLAMAASQVNSNVNLTSSSFMAVVELAVGDVIDFRLNQSQSAAAFTLFAMSLSILQLSSSTIVPLSAWNAVAGTSQAMVANANYFTQNSSLTTFTLPLAANAGSIIEIAGYGTGGWTIAQNAGQSIIFGNRTTTTGTGGSISSTNQNDNIKLLCLIANTQWTSLRALGNLTIV